MKTIKIITAAILISPLLFSCGGEDYKTKYEQDLAQYKTDSLSIIKEKFELLLSYDKTFAETEEVFEAKTHKEVEIFIDDLYRYRPMNTIYVDNRFFAKKYDHPFELNTYANLCNVRRLIDGEKLSFYDEQTPSINYEELARFKKYCNDFVNSKYLMVQGELESVNPEIVGDEFIQGSMKGLFALYDFQTKKVLDNFLFEAKSSEKVDYSGSDDVTLILFTDFLHNISFAISQEANARYTIEGNSGVPMLMLSELTIEEYRKEVLK